MFMLNFCVNVSMLWRDQPFVTRLHKAKEAGFNAVEFLWPRGENLDDIANTIQSLGLKVALHNMDAGDIAKGERGYANDPARRDEWREAFQVAVSFAKRVGNPRLNCLVGNDTGAPRDEQLAVAEENFHWALPIAQSHGIAIMVEPLNLFDTPKYLLGNTPDGVAFVERFNSPSVQLQYDAYHMQRMEGDVVGHIQRYLKHITHIQVADHPGRHEPGTGEMNYRAIFQAIEDSGYNGYVGLEYLANTTPEESFQWIPQGKRNGCKASELNL
jgi:hydroxypyruvate isomerase